MKKILVPTDFSEVSQNAVQYAIDLAKKVDAEITLYHSVHFDYFQDFQYGYHAVLKTMVDEVKEAIEKRMKEFIDKFDTDIKITPVITALSMVPGIKDMVREDGHDLVVIGTHGCSGVEELLVGSNAEKIVRHAPCPVITVPSKSSLKNVSKILVPVDLREIRASFLDHIRSLQQLFGCELEFIWVKTPHNIEDEGSVAEDLRYLFDKHRIKNYSFFTIKNIFPTDGIFVEASESKADMVAMATHARRGISHWLSGSMTEDTINHLDIPVWTFRIDKSEKVIELDSVKSAQGTPEYKKLDVV